MPLQRSGAAGADRCGPAFLNVARPRALSERVVLDDVDRFSVQASAVRYSCYLEQRRGDQLIRSSAVG